MSYNFSNASEAKSILMWHWGKEGAGAKFTKAIGETLMNDCLRQVHLSVAEGSDLDQASAEIDFASRHSVRIFKGDKSALTGKLSAGLALLRVPKMGIEFNSWLHTINPDIALCTFPSLWDMATLPTLRRMDKRFVMILHDAEPHPGDNYPFRSDILSWEVHSADALIVMSDHVAARARERYQFPANRIFKIPHGRFDFGHPPSVARVWGHHRPLRLLFLGIIVDYKGLDLLLEAYEYLRKAEQPVTLTIKGSGDLARYRQKLSQLHDITIQNSWLSDDDIGEALDQADLVILPYKEASQSGVAASAFARGLPVIVTPVGGIQEQIKDGHTGLITESISSQALAATIERILRSPELYHHLSKGALHHAMTDLSWSKIGPELAQALDQIAAMDRRRHDHTKE